MSTQSKKLCPILPFNNLMKLDLATNNFITPDELAEIFKISKSSIYRLIDKRQIPFFKIGGKLRFAQRDVDNYLENVRIEQIAKQHEYI